MAMSVGSQREGAIAEINVTPMADVMIVLLIIFMVTVPIVSRSSVPLPAAAHTIDKSDNPLTIVVKSSGEISVAQATLGNTEALAAYLGERVAVAGIPSMVLVQADRDLAYAAVARVLDVCRLAGIEQIGLAAEKKIGS